MAGGAAALPDGDRVTSAPVALVVHIVTVTVFGVLGAFQFGRRRRGVRHRVAGRLVALCGLVAAGTGLWLTLFLPPTPLDSVVLTGVRVVVVGYMAASLVLGFLAVRRRDFAGHRAWMIRGYAIGMGAGTQFLTQAAWLMVAGSLTVSGRAGTMTAAWLINAVVAELIIRRKRVRRAVRSGGTRVSAGRRGGAVPHDQLGRQIQAGL
ncbi:DUF2306 domain-containing protein [Actinoplanes sp. NEAU-A11]|uniref:DUF2306 domain-containing protein n=1 Tax=Actinoplanes aureus TaxID=2792083 RepID=A0A931C9H9_9ACTN|nr:DUF2306 domain-containing protein [Actinoplanes aureus]